MTESRLENRATPLTNGESVSGPVVAKTAPASTTTTTKLNPSAKSFVLNSAAAAWTPSSPAIKPAAAPAAMASPALKPAAAPATVASPAPKLKAEAKPFVPSFMAKPFVPSFAAAPAAPATPVTTPETPAAVHKEAEPTTTTETAQPEAPVEPEVEDTKESVAPAAAVEAASEPAVKATVDTPAVAAAPVAAKPEVAAAVAVETSVEAEQAAIGERIIYSIAKLLELEPESCPMPPSVVGLPVAAETTGKASTSFSSEPASGKNTRGGGRRGGGGGGDSSRSLNRSNSNYSEGGRGGRRGGGGRGGGRHNPHDTAPALEDCVPLAINEETRWKPSHSKSRLDASAAADSVDATETSLKEAKALLNKLSIEKFEKLSNELIDVAVRSIDVLTGVIELIILKAKMEWHFATMYAELCTKMACTQMPAVTIDGEVVEDTPKLFRRLLLKRCEQEFREAPSREGFELLAPDDVAEKELILKRGTLGHIRFVGELFKLRLIKSRIMHQCVANLFGDTEQPDEESLECLTNLLATIGQVFEANAASDGERAAIAQYYAVIKALSQNAARLSTRIRFMLQDLLDLRKNRWVARRKETKAMTIAEVHAEAKREADEKAKASGGGGGSSARLQRSQSMNAASDRRRTSQSSGGGASDAWKARAAGINVAAPSSSSSSGASASAAPTVDADGWETVASGRPKLVKSRSNSDRFPAPVSSSPAAAGRPPKSNSTAARGAGGNKDAARGGRRERDRSGSSSSIGGGSFSALRRGNSLSDLGRPPTSSQPLAKSASSSSSSSSSADVESAPKASLTAAAFEKQVRAILDEFVETRDLDEATQCFAELASREHHALIAVQSLNIGLEKGAKQRAGVAALLAGLHARGVVTTDELATPLHELLEFAEDMEIDIPLTLQYVAEMIAPSIASGAVPLPRVVASVQHLAHNGKAARVVAKTLVAVGDDARAKQLATDAALDLLPLLAESDRNAEALEAFCTDAKLQFLLA